ncbi:MAG TPA: hypothetical protein VHE32_13120 [Rhodanobacteraceae bacterium]|nr:hypothetical protein [Rhodanobacteraceae bacterium]
MSEFEYITVLLSIIIGLGVTQLLSGVARLIRDGRALGGGWWIFIIVATLLLADLQVWWVSFGWRQIEEWTFFGYVAFLILPILLYLLSYLVLPSDLHLDGDALARAFIAKRKPFFLLMMLIAPASFFQQWMLAGGIRPDLDSAMRLLWIVLAVPGFVSSRIAVQAAVAVASFVLLATYIALLFVRMS